MMKPSAELEKLLEEWLYSMFLLKAGIFKNELNDQPLDKCFKSEGFREISREDLLNQGLINCRGRKKVKLD